MCNSLLGNIEYLRLQSYTKKCIYSKNKLELDKGDVIHSAYIALYEAGKEYSFDNIIPFIIKYIVRSNDNLNDLDKHGEIKVDEGIFKGINMICCRNCKKTLPVSFYRSVKVMKHGTIQYRKDCKGCEYEIRRNYLKKETLTIEQIEKKKEYAKNYRNQRKAIINNNQRLKDHFSSLDRERAVINYPKRKDYFINYSKQKRQNIA